MAPAPADPPRGPPSDDALHAAIARAPAAEGRLSSGRAGLCVSGGTVRRGGTISPEFRRGPG